MSEAARVSDGSRRLVVQPLIDETIASLAARQHLVFALSQVTELGLTTRGVQHRAARGALHRIHIGVYSLVPRQLLTRKGHWMAAVLACGPDAVLSHRNAAALHGIRDTQRTNIDVTIPRRSFLRRPGIDVHTTKILLPQDLTIVDNIPCTSVARTKLDLAEVVSYRAMELALDRSEMLDLFDLRAIEDQTARNPTRRGTSIIDRLLREHYVGTTLTWNELEEAFFAITRRLGLPDPLVNEWVDLHDGEPAIKADFVWRPQRVIVETDGPRVHGTARARERDPRRDQRAIVAGWKPIRTTCRQVFRRPQELEPTLIALVGPT